MNRWPELAPMLRVEHLRTEFATRGGIVTVVDDVSFDVEAGQVMALVGESGSGKSMTARSIMGLVEAPGRICGGAIRFKGDDLRGLAPERMRRLRGNRIAAVFQDSALALNPVMRIDAQMIEAVRAHQNVSSRVAHAMACEAAQRVGFDNPGRQLRAYPHEFSGGMRQRVAIAIAILNKPDLIICDEPTTALDMTLQAQILYEMQALSRTSGTALIWITHDLSVVAGLADTISVMYAGKIVESGTARDVLGAPRHPYTAGLIASTLSRHAGTAALTGIGGMAPSLLDLPTGCAFAPRCARADGMCAVAPGLTATDGRAVRCFHALTAEADGA